jgi:hypothetical protein|tara:strand:+ start:2191 stop:2625 length:435 start_codon:yes stop_codon:yes gene_type:complete
MAYLYIDKNRVNEWGHNIIMEDDAEKTANPNHNNCYKEFNITQPQYEDLKFQKKFVRFNDSDELEWMDIDPITWNSLEEINQYVTDNFGEDPTIVFGVNPSNVARKEVYDQIKAIDWSGETFPLTGHFHALCAAKGLTWNPKDF